MLPQSNLGRAIVLLGAVFLLLSAIKSCDAEEYYGVYCETPQQVLQYIRHPSGSKESISVVNRDYRKEVCRSGKYEGYYLTKLPIFALNDNQPVFVYYVTVLDETSLLHRYTARPDNILKSEQARW